MHVHGQIIRRVIGILGAAAVAGALVMTMTSSFAATTPAFAVKGNIAGGITTIQNGQTLTFVFTETNQSSKVASRDLVLTKSANVSVEAMTCVLPGGFAINPDSPACEPGFLKPGQRSSMVITTTVTGASGAAALARVCLNNEANGVMGPCKTQSVKIA